MAVKRYFDGSVLIETEVPDQPLPVTSSDRGAQRAIADLNPAGVDPHTLTVDAAQLPDLVPTAGAMPITKFGDPLPGNGEGAGIGQKSGASLRDAWANNPDRDNGTVDTVQSGPIGSAAVAAPAAPGIVVVAGNPDNLGDDAFEAAKASWSNKEDVRAYIAEQGGEDPHANATRAELEEAARAAYDASKLSKLA